MHSLFPELTGISKPHMTSRGIITYPSVSQLLLPPTKSFHQLPPYFWGWGIQLNPSRYRAKNPKKIPGNSPEIQDGGSETGNIYNQYSEYWKWNNIMDQQNLQEFRLPWHFCEIWCTLEMFKITNKVPCLGLIFKINDCITVCVANSLYWN